MTRTCITVEEFKARVQRHIDVVNKFYTISKEKNELRIFKMSKIGDYIKEIFFIRVMKDSMGQAIKELDPSIDLNRLEEYKGYVSELEDYIGSNTASINMFFGNLHEEGEGESAAFNNEAEKAYEDFMGKIIDMNKARKEAV